MIRAEGVCKYFRRGLLGKRIVAVDNVSIEIEEGETVALIGESGSGKTTLGKILIMLIRPDRGRVYFNGTELTRLKGREIRRYRRYLQYIPQNPEEAFDPRWRIYDSLAEPLRIHKIDGSVKEIAKMVGLRREHLMRRPSELSGGELQRAAIARAIALMPKFIVCDEPTSMLDLSTQAAIVRLLIRLQKRFNISYLFITHDVELAEYLTDKIFTMRNGRLFEGVVE